MICCAGLCCVAIVVGLAAGMLGLFLGGGAVIFSNLNYTLTVAYGPSTTMLLLAIITAAGALPWAMFAVFPTPEQEAILLLVRLLSALHSQFFIFFVVDCLLD